MRSRFIVIFSCFVIGVFGQTGTNPNYETSVSKLVVNTGYGFFTYHEAELGIGYARYSRSGRMDYGRGYGLSGMVVVDTVPCFGPKAEGWLNGGYYHLSFAAWSAYLITSKGGSLRVCPQLGFGGKRWRVNYGYSFAVTGSGFRPANTHTISFNILVDVLSLRSHELGADRTMQKKKKHPDIVPR
jgi:hypothetical protein